MPTPSPALGTAAVVAPASSTSGVDPPHHAPPDVRAPDPVAPDPVAAAASGSDVGDRTNHQNQDIAEPTASLPGWPLALLIVIIGMFMSVLDISIVNVAIPTIQNQFGVASTDIQWISTAYSLTLGVVVPVSGWLGERFGLGRVYAVSVIGFGVGSALCGLAWDLNSLIFFRILQAIPGGILPVISLTMVYRIVPKGKIGIGMAAYGLSAVFAPATGPTLGGYLVEYQSWPMIFFINVPVGLVAAALAFTLLPEFPRLGGGRFDVWGFVTVAGALFALLLALSKGADWGWTGYRVSILLVSSALLMALFVVIELEVDRPLLDVRLFLLWSFTNAQLLVAALSAGFFAVLFYVPLFLQEGQHFTPLSTGLLMLPEALAMGFTLPIAGFLYDKVGPRWPAAVGVGVTAVGTYLLCGITPDMTPLEVMIWTSLRGVGNALAMVPIMTAGLSMVPPGQIDAASAINNVVQRVAGALGLAVLSSVATVQHAQSMADRSALLVGAGPDVDPRIVAMRHDGPAGFLPYLQMLELKVQAQVYSDLFLIVTAATAIGALLALTFSGSKPDTAHAPGAGLDVAL